MKHRNKLLSILTVLIANPAYAQVSCNTQPSCATLGYSTATVVGCPTNGYIYCPFDTSYKKCVVPVITCPNNQTSCNHKIICAQGICDVSYYNCEDAGYYSRNLDSACHTTKQIYLRNGTTKTCYTNCTSIASNHSCGTLGYDSPGSCSDISSDWINLTIPTSGGNLKCEMCVGDDYKLSQASKPETINIANMSETECRDFYITSLETPISDDDCIVYV